MIKHYSDHAANERTFLAWIRTAIAVMAFGFIIERFDLFMRFAQKASGMSEMPIHYHANDAVGAIFIALGILMMVVATIRHRQVGKEIDRENIQKTMTGRGDTAFAALLIILSLAMCLTLFQVFASLF